MVYNDLKEMMQSNLIKDVSSDSIETFHISCAYTGLMQFKNCVVCKSGSRG